ncbi:hypothetical protein DYU05_20565 [Mucilaginibacter terrenus]|uniref:Uncharacterized protein n=1 Tax=Mucilaginibacter terrenus TaxID=2482727 RepID=A0A3E2NJQ0_9SPHI|nr:hypothetical protein [Mucilaginibacter terrenus]RFZ81153.1 hypothetical protein DYU05_20565 [Mucilaginibacter terrenus]
MSNLLNELLGSSKALDEQKGFVFFNDEHPEGYTSKESFLASLRKQKNGKKAFRVGHTKTMFDNMALGRGLLSEPTLSNEDGEQVIWIRFGYGKTKQNLQILNECGMYDFIMDYAHGRIQNVPTFEKLINSISQQ